MTGSLIEFEHVSKSFGSVLVTDDLSFTLYEGEALGVVGPNGAGKTTLMNLISGVLQPDAGRMTYAGQDLAGLSGHARCWAGIGRTHQIPQPFEGMTVFENVYVGALFGRPPAGEGMPQRCMELLDRVALVGKRNAPAGSLTLLERKRLELARALATQPRLLLLDEIAGGLTEAEVAELIETIRDLRNQGISLIWIEHIVHALLQVVDRLIAIDFGKVLKDGSPQDVMASPEVRSVYMGIGA